jgi:hypothetical protein
MRLDFVCAELESISKYTVKFVDGGTLFEKEYKMEMSRQGVQAWTINY